MSSNEKLLDEAAEALVKTRLLVELGRANEINGLIVSPELKAKVDEAAKRTQDAFDARRMGHVPYMPPMGGPTRRQTIIGILDDMVTDLFYYDRKGDGNLPVGALEEAIKAGEITLEEMVTVFRRRLNEAMAGKL